MGERSATEQWQVVTMHTTAGDLDAAPTYLAATLKLVEVALINDVPVTVRPVDHE